MKSSSFIVRSTVLAMLALSAAPRLAQATPRPARRLAPVCARHTVLQFFDLLPSRYFDGYDRHEKLDKKQSRPPIIDIAHDYLQVWGENGDPLLEIAVFRFGSQETVGVSATYPADAELHFYRMKNGRLRDVTRQVFPRRLGRNQVTETYQVADLPRIGTTIRVSDEYAETGNQKLAYSLHWRGGRFVAR